MSMTLYRKYRPQKFSEVVGQNHIKVTLQNEIATGKLAHAYLFSGPRGIGKTTVARILAKALNCQQLQSNSEPCDRCLSCEEIKAGRSLDLVEIDAASNRGINEIRELREQTKYTPLKEKYKVFIIDEAHMLTTEAFNALLKTLEEPPAHALFILATTEIHKIPETIISRCQRFDFQKVPLQAAIGHLAFIAEQEAVVIENLVLENIARSSEGYLRDAVSLLGQVLALGEKQINQQAASLVLPRSDWQRVMELIVYLLNGQTKDALLLVDRLFEEGVDFEHFTRILVETWRKILLCKMTGEWQRLAWEAGDSWLKKIVQAGDNFSGAELAEIIEIFLAAQLSLKQSLIVQLPLEVAIVKVAELHKVATAKPGVASDLPPAGPSKPGSGAAGQQAGLPKNRPPAANQLPSSLKIEEIQSRWPEVIEALRSHNHSLASFLQVGRPVELDGHAIIVGFQYNFHYERIKESKYLAVVHDVLKRVFGLPLTLVGLIDQRFSLSAAKPGEQQLVEQVLETFGGEVIG